MFLFQSTVQVARSLHELQELMHNLPDYADQFLNMICKILGEYRETCQSSYRSRFCMDIDNMYFSSC